MQLLPNPSTLKVKAPGLNLYMPPKKERARLQVIKVPLDYLPIIKPPNFPPIPRLYLDLLENKKKVKPELRNKEYVPKDVQASTLAPTLVEAEKATKAVDILKNDGVDSGPDDISMVEPSKVKTAVLKTKAVKTKTPKDGGIKIIDLSKMSQGEIDASKAASSSRPSLADSNAMQKLKSVLSPKNKEDLLTGGFPKSGPSLDEEYRKHRVATGDLGGGSVDTDKDRDRDRNRDPDRDRRDREDDKEREDRHREKEDRYRRREEEKEKPPRRYQSEESSSKDDSSSSGRDLSKIIAPAAAVMTLEKMLQGESHPETVKETFQPSSSSSSSTGGVPKMAPSLAKIAEGKPMIDGDGIRDASVSSPVEEDEMTKKRDILFRFKILRRGYPQGAIPEYTEYTDLKTLQREYDSVVRQLALDATVENYRKYLIISFYVLEFVLGNLFHFEEIKGFTQQQLLGMNQYERLLFAIGEKSYLSGRKPWPPEVQLVGIILLNGAIFIGGKMLFKATGANIMAMLNPQPQQAASNQGPTFSSAAGGKPKMRGPDIDLTDLTGKKGV